MNVIIVSEVAVGYRVRAAGLAAAATVAALGVTACGSSSGAGSSDAAVSVVASTNVYGDIAAQVAGSLAGSRVHITSVISDPDADPHSYEANPRTLLAISKADVIIENGGGYDDFVDRMRSSSNSEAPALNVVDLSGRKAPAGGDLNEHVWYDFPTVVTLVGRLAGELSTKDPKDAATFRANAATFTGKLRDLIATEASIKTADAGEGVAVTEPVPLYLLQACGLVNRTPARFSEAIEDGTDVPVGVQRDTLALMSGRKVALLAYNEQTSSPETQQVLSAARANGIGIVPVTETLPAGRTYLSWMQGNLAAVRAALAS